METNIPSRLRLQYGALQVEFEGSYEFLKTELPALLERIARLLPHPQAVFQPVPIQVEPPAHQGEPPPQVHLGTVRF